MFFEFAVGANPISADDFLTYNDTSAIADSAKAYVISGKSQLSVREVDGSDNSNFGGVVLNGLSAAIAGLDEQPEVNVAHSNVASTERTSCRLISLTPFGS